MKLTIHFIAPDGKPVPEGAEVIIDQLMILGADFRALEHIIRSVAHGYGVRHGLQVGTITILTKAAGDIYSREIEAQVTFRKTTGLTLEPLFELLQKARRLLDDIEAELRLLNV